jgi:hypothetical protein
MASLFITVPACASGPHKLFIFIPGIEGATKPYYFTVTTTIFLSCQLLLSYFYDTGTVRVLAISDIFYQRSSFLSAWICRCRGSYYRRRRVPLPVQYRACTVSVLKYPHWASPRLYHTTGLYCITAPVLRTVYSWVFMVLRSAPIPPCFPSGPPGVPCALRSFY